MSNNTLLHFASGEVMTLGEYVESAAPRQEVAVGERFLQWESLRLRRKTIGDAMALLAFCQQNEITGYESV